MDESGCHTRSSTGEYHCHRSKEIKKESDIPRSSGDKEHVCVYIYRREDGSPAYIGISNNPERRFKQHSKDGRAFAHMHRSVRSCHASRSEALAVERSLIRGKCSILYNKAGC